MLQVFTDPALEKNSFTSFSLELIGICLTKIVAFVRTEESVGSLVSISEISKITHTGVLTCLYVNVCRYQAYNVEYLTISMNLINCDLMVNDVGSIDVYAIKYLRVCR